MFFSPSPFAPENLVSRDGFGSHVLRQPAHLHTQAESGAYLPSSAAAASIYLFNTVIRHRVSQSFPSLSGQAVTYRWRSFTAESLPAQGH